MTWKREVPRNILGRSKSRDPMDHPFRKNILKVKRDGLFTSRCDKNMLLSVLSNRPIFRQVCPFCPGTARPRCTKHFKPWHIAEVDQPMPLSLKRSWRIEPKPRVLRCWFELILPFRAVDEFCVSCVSWFWITYCMMFHWRPTGFLLSQSCSQPSSFRVFKDRFSSFLPCLDWTWCWMLKRAAAERFNPAQFKGTVPAIQEMHKALNVGRVCVYVSPHNPHMTQGPQAHKPCFFLFQTLDFLGSHIFFTNHWLLVCRLSTTPRPGHQPIEGHPEVV